MKHLATLTIPSVGEALHIEICSGDSFIFLGANGAGKTRLGVFIENTLPPPTSVHRIAAHRSLALNTKVIPPSLEVATNRLLFGYEEYKPAYKNGSRWNAKPETTLLNDFDFLLAALYAENNQLSVDYRQERVKLNDFQPPPLSKLDKLKDIWRSVLPHRELIVLSGNIRVTTLGENKEEYEASELSDGERVIFYLIGQALMAPPDTVLIFDEPELHINKAIIDALWDSIESIRKDCAIIYITHDITFSSSRRAATKYAVKSYQKNLVIVGIYSRYPMMAVSPMT